MRNIKYNQRSASHRFPINIRGDLAEWDLTHRYQHFNKVLQFFANMFAEILNLLSLFEFCRPEI